MTAATSELPEDLSGLGVGVFNLLFFLGGAVSVALAGAILRARAGTASPWNPLAGKSAPEFSDAMLIVVAYGLAAVLLTAVTVRSARHPQK